MFVGFDELNAAPYQKIASFRACVLYPYDVALMLFYELYSMNMPLFIPHADVLQFYVFRGLHSSSKHHGVDPSLEDDVFPVSPFFPALDAENWFKGANYWAKRTDFAQFPYLVHFRKVSEIFHLLETADLGEISRSMETYNTVAALKSSLAWAHTIESLMMS